MNKLYINGQWKDAIDGRTMHLINPATEEILETLPCAGKAETDAAILAASHAFQAWSRTTPYTRAAILKKAADHIRENLSELAKDMVLESGKPLPEAKGEWSVAANLFEWYAEEAKRAYGRTIPTNRPDKRSSVIWQPMGVIGIITAWNFPAYNPARAWAAALAAGCTVVAKSAESTPISACHILNALIKAGLPPGVLNLVIGDPSAIGEAMLDHPLLKKISFTGSTRVGKILMDGASRTHTRLSLELGGNAPVLIFGDLTANEVEALAKAASIARFRNNGQVCIAPQRFYVEKSIFALFAERVTHYVSELKMGNGFEEGVHIGPLITKDQRDSVLALLEEAKSQRATILTGGTTAGKGFFIRPAVVTGLDQNSVLARKEIFGPILPLFSFDGLEDALSKANDTEYGLAAYLFTNHLPTAIRAAEGLQFGIIGINEWAPHGTEAPFGGWKQSGQGHESGPEGLYEYMEKKLISIGGL